MGRVAISAGIAAAPVVTAVAPGAGSDVRIHRVRVPPPPTGEETGPPAPPVPGKPSPTDPSAPPGTSPPVAPPAPGAPPQSPPASPGGLPPGTYELYCTIHVAAGMKTALTVS